MTTPQLQQILDRAAATSHGNPLALHTMGPPSGINCSSKYCAYPHCRCVKQLDPLFPPC